MGVLIEGRLEGADMPDPTGVLPPALMRAVTESALLLERRVKLNTPIGVTGVARHSVGHRIERGGSVQRGVHIRAELGSPARHVGVLERGRRRGARRPPADALELWVRRKLGITDRKEARGVAFVIARAIGKRGMDAIEMFEQAADDSEREIQAIFDRAGLAIQVRMTRGRA